MINPMLKGQSAAEYVTLVALVFVLVASLILISFRQQELTLALASTRLACIDYSSLNSSVTCREVRYYYVGSQNVTIVPVTDGLGPNEKEGLRKQIISNYVSIFRPGATTAGSCFVASFYSFCLSFV